MSDVEKKWAVDAKSVLTTLANSGWTLAMMKDFAERVSEKYYLDESLLNLHKRGNGWKRLILSTLFYIKLKASTVDEVKDASSKALKELNKIKRWTTYTEGWYD